MAAKTVEVRTTHADLLKFATQAHEETGGAPVEVRDGSRVVKIGPWPSKDLRAKFAEMLPMVMEFLKGKRNPDAN